MDVLISSSIIACLKSFNEFIEDIRHLQDKNPRGLDSSAWEDELGRLRMWAANIGAHETGQCSLDFRLRDASHVRVQIIKLLQGLLRRLQDARDVLADEKDAAEDDAVDDVEDVVEDDTEDDTLDQEDQKTEIQELQESLTTNVNCLFQMLILVRKPAQHDLYLGPKRADVAVFEPFDYNYVKQKFPEADDALVRRLGSAITRRRKYLKYRERLAIELRKGVSNVDPAARDVQEIYGVKTMDQRIRVPMPDDYFKNLEQQNIIFDDKASDTGISQTYHAPTSLYGRNIAIPAPSNDALDGNPFECPYCFHFITISGQRSWNNHVLQDLQPYVCIDLKCTIPGKLYSTKHEWMHHLRVAHPATTTDDGAPKESDELVDCPLCKEETQLGEHSDDHVASHLLELALLILPDGAEDSKSGKFHDADSTSNPEHDRLSESRDGSEPPKGLSAVPAAYSAASRTQNLLYPEFSTQKYWSVRGFHEKEKVKHSEITERVRLLGLEHTDTLRSMTELARLFADHGTYGEASQWERQVMEIKKRLLGADHPETLESMMNLARYAQGPKQSIDAEMMYQQALNGYEKTIGPDHIVTLSVTKELSSLHIKQGMRAEAEVKYLQALNGYLKTLGPNHAITLDMCIDLGDFYKEKAIFAKAEAMYKQALNGYTISLGSDHTVTLSAITNLGKLYEQQNKLAEAEVRYLQALSGYIKTLGSNHTTVLDMCNDLGGLYEKQINFAKAEAMYERVLNEYSRNLGFDHNSTLSTMDKLGRLYEQQNKLAPAEAMYKRALTGYRKTLGPDDPTTIAAAEELRSLHARIQLVDWETLHRR